MIVGGAVRFKDAANALYAVKKNIREFDIFIQDMQWIRNHNVYFRLTRSNRQAVGSGPCVGLVGATMGGGIGRLEGLYGLTIDSLLSVRIMLANTTVVEASTETNADLFWGIRGAGANFGFVLNATYRVYDEVPNGQNLNADFQFPHNASRAFYQALKDNGPKMPPQLCIATTLEWDPTYNEVQKNLLILPPVIVFSIVRVVS